jgi:hypothetical protein
VLNLEMSKHKHNNKKKQHNHKPKHAARLRVSQPSSRKTPSSKPSIGSRVGAFIGNTAQKYISSITGFGDYKIRGQTLGSAGPPRFNGGRNPIISHREFLGDVLSSTTFSSTTYTLNPGLQQTFPWLNAIATNFEQYKFRGCVF